METKEDKRQENSTPPDHRLDDWLITTYLIKEGETVEDAKRRLKEKTEKL